MPDVKYANTLLQSFDSELIARLQLKSVAFQVGHEIEFPGKPIKHLFFLEERMASMTTTLSSQAWKSNLTVRGLVTRP